jgi:hypothetical protein
MRRLRALVSTRMLVAVAVVAFVLAEGATAFVRRGDAVEYIVTTEAWLDHASPEIRSADVESMRRRHADGLETPIETIKSVDGSTYTVHFWLYPLLCVPAKALLRLFHANELRAFALTNAVAFAVATCVAWSSGNAVAWRRRAFAVLAAVAPGFWYIRWSSPETFSWACVVVALAMLDRKRYALAAAVAGIASLHNPPIAMLAAAIVASAFSTRRLVPIALAGLGAATSLLAALFYLVKLGVPSPLIIKSATSVSLISAARTSSLLFDANQGLLPFAPVFVIGLPIAVIYAARRREVATLAVAVALAAMILTMQTQKNWNGGCAGIIRYGVWTLPILGWLIVRELPSRRSTYAFLSFELVWQLVTVVAHFDADEDYTEHHWIARLLLDHAPSLYNPDPEIFVERTIHTELPQSDYPELLPVAYERADGEITKLVVTPETFPIIRRRFEVRPDYRPILEQRAGDGPLAIYHYVNPPKGTVRGSFPPMRVAYAGCDEVVPERNGRWCVADSRLAVHNLGAGGGHIKIEMIFERPTTPCDLDIEHEGHRDHMTVTRGSDGTRYATTLIVPGGQEVWLRFASTNPPEHPNGAHHLIRDVAIVRADAP